VLLKIWNGVPGVLQHLLDQRLCLSIETLVGGRSVPTVALASHSGGRSGAADPATASVYWWALAPNSLDVPPALGISIHPLRMGTAR
jgi:hypothetical protein